MLSPLDYLQQQISFPSIRDWRRGIHWYHSRWVVMRTLLPNGCYKKWLDWGKTHKERKINTPENLHGHGLLDSPGEPRLNAWWWMHWLTDSPTQLSLSSQCSCSENTMNKYKPHKLNLSPNLKLFMIKNLASNPLLLHQLSLQIATHESPSPYIQWHNLWLQVLKCLAHSFKSSWDFRW